MATTTYEKLLLGATELNSASGYVIENLVFTPAQMKPLWASNADADGDALVGAEQHFGPAFFDFDVRVLQTSTPTEAYAAIGTLLDVLRECERTEGGQAMVWTPHDVETTFTAYVLLGELTELPITQQGELAGYFVKSPVLKCHLTCAPGLETAERTVLSSTESGAEPVQVKFISGVKGDLEAKARLIVTDAATQTRRWCAWGRYLTASESAATLLLTAANLTNVGSTSTTRSGAYSEEKVKRMTATQLTLTACTSGLIANNGAFRVFARVYGESSNLRIRCSYRVGDGPLASLPWQTLPQLSAFSQIELGEVFLDTVVLGAQESEIKIEVKSVGASAVVDINYLVLMPTEKGYGKARGTAIAGTNEALAYDEITAHAAGNLAGKVAPLGGTWELTAGSDAQGLTVDATNHYATRAEKEDASVTAGAYLRLGTGKATAIDIQGDIYVPAKEFGYEAGKFRQGIFCRFADSSNWLMAVVEPEPVGAYMQVAYLRLYQRVAGTVTELGTPSFLYAYGTWFRLRITVDTGGSVRVYQGYQGSTYVGQTIEASSSALATGGALAEGGFGFYDCNTSTLGSTTRAYDNLYVAVGASPGTVCYSAQSIQFRYDGPQRANAASTRYGQPPLYRGGNFGLEPGGKAGWVNRLAVMMRRGDVDVDADANVTDKQKIEVLAIERYLSPR